MTPGHRLLCLSKPALYCPELFPCVRTTNPIKAYNYNTVKSKIEPHRVSILVLVGCWHAQNPPPNWLHTPWLRRALSTLSHSCTSSANTSNCCWWPHALRMHVCLCHWETISWQQLCYTFLMHTVNTATRTQTNQKLSGEIKKMDTHACWHKSQRFYKGCNGLKEDPAGYYGMSGICWGKYWPACLSMQSLECLDCTLSLSPFSPYLGYLRFSRREKKMKH